MCFSHPKHWYPEPVKFHGQLSAQGKTRQRSADEPLTSLVFKTVSEPHVGELSYIRIFSGSPECHAGPCGTHWPDVHPERKK